MKNETFDEMAREVMRKIQRHDQHALGVIRAALRKAYALGEQDAEQSVQLTGLCVCPEEWSVDIRGNCSNCGLAKTPRN